MDNVYVVYNPVDRVIRNSRDVVFKEDLFPLKLINDPLFRTNPSIQSGNSLEQDSGFMSREVIPSPPIFQNQPQIPVPSSQDTQSAPLRQKRGYYSGRHFVNKPVLGVHGVN